MAEIRYMATGRRKTSVARVIMMPGSGQIVVNNTPYERYFPRETLQMMIRQPLELCGLWGKFDVRARVHGLSLIHI